MANNHTYSIKEAAAVLKTHTSTVEELIAAGELPAGRIGRQYALRITDVHAYIDKVILKQTTERLTKGRRPKSSRASLHSA